MLGILLLDKPLGCTSHDVVNDIRHRFGTRRVGHAGTLDPLAIGLLVVAVGPATRFLQYLPLEPKEYIAEITFGRATASYDLEGDTISTGEVPDNLTEKLEAIRPQFSGLISQTPPMFSAVKVAGKALYKYARAGEEVHREPRNIHVGELEFSHVTADKATARVVCSGGTYIRTLAHDIGQAIGCGAHLSALQRTHVGRFTLDQATPLNHVSTKDLMPLQAALAPMPMIELNLQQTENVREGRQIGVPEIPDARIVGLVEPGFGVFSVARVHGNLLQPECVIPSEALHGTL